MPGTKPKVPPNPVFSSDLGYLFFLTAQKRYFLIKKIYSVRNIEDASVEGARDIDNVLLIIDLESTM